jgi:hypothetical protein
VLDAEAIAPTLASAMLLLDVADVVVAETGPDCAEQLVAASHAVNV